MTAPLKRRSSLPAMKTLPPPQRLKQLPPLPLTPLLLPTPLSPLLKCQPRIRLQWSQ
jgi:hypothetical protein